MTESKWNTKFSKLLVLAFLLILLPIVNATSFGYNYLKNNPSGDQDLSTYVEGNMSAETYNETIITPTTNYSLSFDGVNDYVGMESSIDIGTNNFTISSWFKATPTSLNKFFIDNGDSSLYTSRVLIGIAPNGKVRFFTNNENNVASEFYTINTYNDNNWHFAVFTRDNNNLSMYIDGVLQKSQPVYGNLGNRSFAIGRSKISSDSTRYFNGSIDEVLIFNRSLSSDEISQLYNSGNGLYANTSIAPFNDGLVAGYHFDEGTGTTAYDITGRNNGTLVNGPTWVDGKISHNLTSTTETLGAIGLMPWVSSTNFISTDFSLQWLNNILLNPWNTISQLGNSTNRFNVFAWNLTADKYFSSDGSQGWTGNCVNASYKNGIVVGCND